MSKTLKLILWIVLIAAVIVGALFAYNKLTADYAPENSGMVTPAEKPDETGGEAADDGADANAESDLVPAPDFTVEDGDGNTVSFSEHLGERPVVLNFWASWCGPCKAEMPDLEEIYATYGDRVDFLMVNLTDGSRETVETAKSFIAESGYTFPVYYDTALSGAAAYSVYSIPTTFVIDADGYMYSYAKGMISKDKFIEMLDGLLAEQAA